MERQDIEVGDTQMRHLIVLLRLGEQCIVGGGWMGLRDALAECPEFEAVRDNAGLTEETDKKIQEAVQNCHSIEKRKEK